MLDPWLGGYGERYPSCIPWNLGKIQIIPVEGFILEPCCGKSAVIANYFRSKHTVITNDIDLGIRANHHLDLSIKSNWNHLPDVHWVITNPPYKYNWQFLMGAYAKAKIDVAFLLRSTWLEDPKSQPERAEWFWEHPMAARKTVPRYAFRRAVKKPDKWQTDACAHVWGPERQAITKPVKNRIFSSLKPLLLRGHTQGFVTIRR